MMSYNHSFIGYKVNDYGVGTVAIYLLISAIAPCFFIFVKTNRRSFVHYIPYYWSHHWQVSVSSTFPTYLTCPNPYLDGLFFLVNFAQLQVFLNFSCD